MEKLVKMHGFWTMLMLLGFVMCVFTGHQMVRKMKRDGVSGRCR